MQHTITDAGMMSVGASAAADGRSGSSRGLTCDDDSTEVGTLQPCPVSPRKRTDNCVYLVPRLPCSVAASGTTNERLSSDLRRLRMPGSAPVPFFVDGDCERGCPVRTRRCQSSRGAACQKGQMEQLKCISRWIAATPARTRAAKWSDGCCECCRYCCSWTTTRFATPPCSLALPVDCRHAVSQPTAASHECVQRLTQH